MTTMHEHRENTITLARTLGLIPDDATPRDLQDIVDQLTDQQVYVMSRRLNDQHHRTQGRTVMTSSTAWPENVIARYLNAAGATVDITDDSHIGRVSVRCQGCTWADYHNDGGSIDDTPAQTATLTAETLPGVRILAQSHAETCRALPNPNA